MTGARGAGPFRIGLANAGRAAWRSAFPARVRDRLAVWASLATALGFALLVAGVTGAVLRVSRVALRELPELDPFALVERLLAGAFTACAVLLLLGSLTTAVSTLFLSEDLAARIALPIPHRSIFGRQLLTTVLAASAPTLLLGLPAIGVASGASPRPFLAGAALTLALAAVVAGSGLAGALGALAFVRLVPPRRARFAAGFLSAAGLSIALVGFRGSRPERLLDPLAALDLLRSLGGAPPAAPGASPIAWAARAGTLALRGEAGGLAIAAMLFAAAAGLVLLACSLFAALHRRLWQETREAGAPRPAARRRGTPARSLSRALLAAEARSLFRDASTPAQLGTLSAVFALYMLNVRLLPTGDPVARDLVAGLQVGLALFLVSALSLRFAFPSLSSDGRAALFLRTYPLSPARHLVFRYVVRGLPAAVIALVLVAASDAALRPSPIITATSILVALAGGLAIPALNLGLGALFPRYDAPNAVAVALGPGGLFALAASSAVSVLATIAVSPELCMLLASLSGISVNRGLLLAAVLTLCAASALPLQMAALSLERTDLAAG